MTNIEDIKFGRKYIHEGKGIKRIRGINLLKNYPLVFIFEPTINKDIESITAIGVARDRVILRGEEIDFPYNGNVKGLTGITFYKDYPYQSPLAQKFEDIVRKYKGS